MKSICITISETDAAGKSVYHATRWAHEAGPKDGRPGWQSATAAGKEWLGHASEQQARAALANWLEVQAAVVRKVPIAPAKSMAGLEDLL